MRHILTYALAILITPIHAFGTGNYAERVVRVTSQGIVTKVGLREFKDPSGVELQDFSIQRGNQPVVRQSAIQGVVSSGGVSGAYHSPIPKNMEVQSFLLLDRAASQQDFANARPLGLASVLNYSPEGTPIADFDGATKMVHEMQQSVESEALAWLRLNEAQITAQNETVHRAQLQTQQIAATVNRNLLNATLTAFTDNSAAMLSQALSDFNLSQDLKGPSAQVEHIGYSQERQNQLINQAFNGGAEEANEIVSDLSSPLNKSTTPETRQQLKGAGVNNGVIPGPIVQAPDKFTFADAELDDSRIRAQNNLQVSGIKYPQAMAGKAGDYGRAAQWYQKAAHQAELAGDMNRARDLQLKSTKIANAVSARGDGSALDFDGQASLEAYAEALKENFTQVEGKFRSTDSEFLKLAKPMHSALQSLSKQTTGPQRTAAERGQWFLDQSDQASALGKKDEAEALVRTTIALIDVAAGFTPVLGVGVDAYQAISGKHWITGEELSTFERTLSVAGVLTAGLGSAAFKGAAKLGPLFKRMNLGEEILKGAEGFSNSLKAAGVKSVQTFSRLRDTFVHSKSLANSESILTQINKPLLDRMRALGLPYKLDELKYADHLNWKTPKEIHTHNPGGLVWGVTMEKTDGLMRLYQTGKNREGQYLIHQSVLDRAKEISPTYEDFNVNLARMLQLGDRLPDSLATLKFDGPMRANISELLPASGEKGAHMQFEVLDKLSESNFINDLSLKEFYNGK